MPNYRILSENLTLGKPGEVIGSENVEGVNFEALVAGGHLEPVIASRKTDKKEQE
jgi:hypothetical protein